jgi:hypothetical protein
MEIMGRIFPKLVFTAFITITVGCFETSDDGTVTANPSGLALAPPAVGVQFHIPSFAVPAGTEVLHCYFFKNPSKVDLEIVRFQVKYTKGSHHTTLYETDQDYPDHDEECPGVVMGNPIIDGFSIFAGAAGEDWEWKLPPGVSRTLKAKRQLMMQVHYVNATTETTAGTSAEVYYNLEATRDTSTIKYHSGSIGFFNQSILIPPRSARTFDMECPLSEDRNILTATGHMHARGTEVDIFYAPDGKNYLPEPIWKNTDWNNQPLGVFDPPMAVKAGGALRFRCSYNNPTDQSFAFGPSVETNEHCLGAVQMYPMKLNFETCTKN